MPRVYITDTILRDAHQSLLATRMHLEDMLPICPKLDQVGYWALEVWGGATFDTCVRFLKEDPWERLKKIREALPNTRLSMLLRGQNLLGYRHYSDDVVRSFVDRSAANGMDVFRIFDALNDLRNVRTAVDAVRKAGKHAQGTICYTTSPVHDNAQFVAGAKELEEMGCNSICIKDMAGLLTPMATETLVKSIVEAVDLPIHIHSHATAGLAEMCQLKAIEAGARYIDTAISSLSSGTSHPPTESMVAALRNTDYDTGLDLPLIQEIGFYFYGVRKKYKRYESEFTGLDTRVQVNQVPGGMVSNLANQLRDQNALDKMNAVLEEIPHVREDMGYPPLVTPSSQIVGTQAVMNVLSGERYKVVTNETKLYLQGRYGSPPGTVNSAVRVAAIGEEPVIECRPADLFKDELPTFTEEVGDLAESPEDVLTYAMFPDVGREFLIGRREGTLVPEPLEPVAADRRKDAAPVPTELNCTVHGETYHVQLRGTGHRTEEKRPFYLSVDGMPEEVMVEVLQEISLPNSNNGGGGSVKAPTRKEGGRPRASKEGDVTTSMPGVIVTVLVGEGDKVNAGDPVIVTEAMKMETEIQAPISGVIKAIHVAKGDSVNPDDALMEIEAE
ncbi:MAG: sodium-extruding oxaloacetate decarboxylase subunit alpha [Gammaproteobacteria bacterium]|nr:sodium-extruding oxaloacetate decarboxylase subunit alpha [Gammaproteobacteria bacterium]